MPTILFLNEQYNPTIMIKIPISSEKIFRSETVGVFRNGLPTIRSNAAASQQEPTLQAA